MCEKSLYVLCREALTYTSVVVGCELETGIALAVIGTRSVRASMVAIWRQGAFINVWVIKKEKLVQMKSWQITAAALCPQK